MDLKRIAAVLMLASGAAHIAVVAGLPIAGMARCS